MEPYPPNNTTQALVNPQYATSNGGTVSTGLSTPAYGSHQGSTQHEIQGLNYAEPFSMSGRQQIPLHPSMDSSNGVPNGWGAAGFSQHQPAYSAVDFSRGIADRPVSESMSATNAQYFPIADHSSSRHFQTWPSAREPYQAFNGLQQPFLDPFHDSSINMMDTQPGSSSPNKFDSAAPYRGQPRQRGTARRVSKTRVRAERSSSIPYSTSISNTPEPISRPLDSGLPVPGQVLVNPNAVLQQPFQYQANEPAPMYSPKDFIPNPYSSNTLPLPTAPPGTGDMSYHTRNILNSTSVPDLGFYYRQPVVYPTSSALYPQASRSPDSVRVVSTPPKPRCWDHGCDGRQFSTFSNLLRHQREKNGVASKSVCPYCGAEFTRSTARNGHMAHEKCKKG